MRKFIGFLIVFILSISVVVASDYNETGQQNNEYVTGRGIFASLDPNSDIDTFTKSVGTPRNTPLITDMDGDGTREVVIIDDDTLTIYSDVDLEFQTSHDFDRPGVTTLSNMVAFDIDDDGFTEVFFSRASRDVIDVFEYNGSQINYYNITLGHTTFDDGDASIKCREAEDCMLAYSRRKDSSTISGVNSNELVAVFFNSTVAGNGTQVDDHVGGGSDSGTFCFPHINTMALADYDGDGNDEYILSYVHITNTGEPARVEIAYMGVNSTNGITIEQKVENANFAKTIFDTDTSGDTSCDDPTNYGKFFTPPLVYDADDSQANLETIITIMEDEDEFFMYEVKSDGNIHDTFPALLSNDGVIVSNMFRMSNVFPDDGGDTFCVIGHDTIDEELELTCSSKNGDLSFFSTETNTFRFDTTGRNNVSTSFDNWHVVAHATQQSNALRDGTDPTEVINAYGIFEINDDCSVFGSCTMDLVFNNPQDEGFLVAADVDNFAANELILLTDSNLYVMSDRSINEPAQIAEVTYNPCIVNAAVKVNTTVQVTVTVNDGNDPNVLGLDDVFATIQPYFGDVGGPNATFSANVTSGSDIQFSFTPDQITSSSILRIEGADTENPNTRDTIDQTYTIAAEGVEFGDTTCTQSFVTEEEDADAAALADLTDTSATNNSVSNVLQEVKNVSGIGIDILFIVMLLLMCSYIWINSKGHDTTMIFAMCSTILIGGLVVGVMLGILSFGIIVTILAVAIIMVAIVMRKMFAGT